MCISLIRTNFQKKNIPHNLWRKPLLQPLLRQNIAYRKGRRKKKKYRVGFSKSSFHVIERGIKIYQTKLCISWLRLKGAHRLLKTFLQPSLLLRSTDFQNRFLNSGLHVLAPFITCIFNIPGDTLITTLCFNCY